MSPVNDNKQPTGKRYWRSLDDLADTPEYRKYVEREFPYLDTDGISGVNRRQFLTLMSASMALGGLTACRRPVEHIVPYVKPPEEVIAGTPLYFSTTMPQGEEAFGLVVESHEGRPTKIEGNPQHPASLGSATALMQAETLNMYDPDRSPRVMNGGKGATWADFVGAWAALHADLVKADGEGLALVTEAIVSPTMLGQLEAFRKAFPKALVAAYEPVSGEQMYAGTKIATGSVLRPLADLAAADRVLALDSDFMFAEDDAIANARAFAKRRQAVDGKAEVNRLYVVESYFSLTGGTADHRLRLPSGKVADFAVALAKELGVAAAAKLPEPTGIDSKWLKAVAEDLSANKGKSLVLAGRRQPAAVHALVVAINDALGNTGKTVSYAKPEAQLSNTADLGAVAKAMAAGTVKNLIIIGGNPAYNAPANFGFADALRKVPFSVHLSDYIDETSAQVTWHLPRASFLEAWGDARSYRGSYSITQPLIAPLYDDAHSPLEVLALVTSGKDAKGYDLVQATGKSILGGSEFEHKWRVALNAGLWAGSAYKPVTPSVDSAAIGAAMAALAKPAEGKIEVVFSRSASLLDGRYANNGWLQECPDPVTKVTWDNAAVMSPTTARKLGVLLSFERLGVLEYDLVTITIGGKAVELPVFALPGHADDSITLELGYGRSEIGRVAKGAGVNIYPLRTSTGADIVAADSVVKTGGQQVLAEVQDHSSMENRALICTSDSVEEYREKGQKALEPEPETAVEQVWRDPVKYDTGNQWGMTIDLSTCMGCNACMVACQSENNVPVVGKTQVGKGREMHWIRIDRYFRGTDAAGKDYMGDVDMAVQPIPCQQCENAPCEQVCPVGATNHDKEGLNAMIYNRCIGTRYCSNNCPYKVRRFNFFNYTKDTPETVKMAMNPDVTMRFRGVMEKCTYCVQRINETKIRAKREDREIVDGEVKTACQQACPVEAITFGNIIDKDSEVAKRKALQRNYGILAEHNTRPRTTYLGRIRNPNPALKSETEMNEHKEI